MQEGIIPKVESVFSTPTYGRFVAEPLNAGFGTTLGNSLRRALLSSLSGSAITWVKIEGVLYEFSTIPHLKEDTLEFLLNVKGIRVRALSDQPGKLYLDVQREGPIYAGDIQAPPDFEIINRDLYLATLDVPEARLVAEFNVEQGRGYQPASQADGLPIGVIPVDAIFSPVQRANFTVERTRVGQLTNYNRLILEVWTNGSLSPSEAVSRSAQILIEQLSYFAEMGRAATRPAEKALLGALPLPRQQYDTPIEDLNLSARSYNCLRREGISKVGEVLQRSEQELMAIRNFGRKSLDELRDRLMSMGFIAEP